jgi:hypothetical protein
VAKIDVARPVAWPEIHAVAYAMVPYGWQVETRGSELLVGRGEAKVMVRLKARKAGARVKIAYEYPWWTWVCLLAGVIPVVIASYIYERMAKDLRNEVQWRLAAALGVPGMGPTGPTPQTGRRWSQRVLRRSNEWSPPLA